MVFLILNLYPTQILQMKGSVKNNSKPHFNYSVSTCHLLCKLVLGHGINAARCPSVEKKTG